MMKVANPFYQRISRVSLRNDCIKIYEYEKKKVKSMLSNVSKISLTTDLWKSKNQKIGYMVVTGHFLDAEWKLNKWVLNFVHILPPHSGDNISDALYKCLKDWGIENKIYTISVDNASANDTANDTAIKNLREIFAMKKYLICGGKLFHVRRCAHILNLIFQDGLSRIKSVIQDIRDSVSFLNQSEARVNTFCEVVQQLQVSGSKLILDCKTRWNSTYDMLHCAYMFKDVFLIYQRKEPSYTSCPSKEGWEKVEKILDILVVFSNLTNIISGSEYPTSNLFLVGVCKIKQSLDNRGSDESAFMKDMVDQMKKKFDKYWGECNLLMSIAAVLDPRVKMRALDFCFPKIYRESEVDLNIEKVKRALLELYN
ncbi:unnamed protein product [Cuscuta europaea]|uniref:hAT-like transposase RNase-H fold domain-containing protein n=1 Tax=Cuscuta europaea TaxID=41803 RepID=A0A9P0Z8S1_CUSEU|nr:unnamed protein product [Cuscuta europaea]